jgi:hypothetical protein
MEAETEAEPPAPAEPHADEAPAVDYGESTVIAAAEPEPQPLPVPPPPPPQPYIYNDPTKPFEPGHNGSVKCWPLRRN